MLKYKVYFHLSLNIFIQESHFLSLLCIDLMFVFMGTNIMFWNCQGVRPKRKELELYLKENNFDIVALNETFLTKK